MPAHSALSPVVRRATANAWAPGCAAVLLAIALPGCSEGGDQPKALSFTDCDSSQCVPPVDGAPAEADAPAAAAPAPSCETWDTEVSVNPSVDIGVLASEQFWALRTGYVDAYQALGVFPSPYLITGPAQAGIYGSIDWSVGWLSPDPFYLENPYLLALTWLPGFVGAAEALCSPTVHYGPGCTVTVTVPPDKSQEWFKLFFDNTTGAPGKAQLTLVNALDAGFNHASIDLQASENVDPAWNAAPGSIVGGLCPITRYFYHHGQSGLNNLSPHDDATNFAFVQRDTKTTITTRLWRAAPASVNVPSDLTYVIRID